MQAGLIVFADTNILLYAASGRPADRGKAELARALLQREHIVISYQVLQEFYANAVHPKKLALSSGDTLAFCKAWLELPIVPLDASIFMRAVEFALRYEISNWDGAILAAAEKAVCKIVYSEDLSHGQRYFGIEVRNPFK